MRLLLIPVLGCDENNVRQTSDGVALSFMKLRRSIQRLNFRSVVRFPSETTPFFLSIEGPSNDLSKEAGAILKRSGWGKWSLN